jgi:methionyl-tRNA synthetase
MGKSLGNTLEPKDLVERFGPDAVRYYFLKEIEFGKDGDFSEERFTNIINANLANTIGASLLTTCLPLLHILAVIPSSMSREVYISFSCSSAVLYGP